LIKKRKLNERLDGEMKEIKFSKNELNSMDDLDNEVIVKKKFKK
jgi:hypothetical protein